jgi:hypothetical protein
VKTLAIERFPDWFGNAFQAEVGCFVVVTQRLRLRHNPELVDV